MNPAAPIRIVAENVIEEARALDAHGGRQHAIEANEETLRVWLSHFAALPALEAEEAGARLHLAHGSEHLLVRWAGGRLGSEKAGTFVAASAEAIVAELLARPSKAGGSFRIDVPASEADEAETPAARARARARLVALAALVVVFLGICAWHLRPTTPEGIVWIENPTERDAVLSAAAGRYTSDTERIQLDAKAGLSATSERGLPLLSTTVRAGRRGNASVLVTAGGVIVELAGDGLRIGGTGYRRVAAGS